MAKIGAAGSEALVHWESPPRDQGLALMADSLGIGLPRVRLFVFLFRHKKKKKSISGDR